MADLGELSFESMNEPLAAPCLACNREQGEPLCDLCQAIVIAERDAEPPP